MKFGPTIVELEIISDQLVGREGGFVAIRRLRLQNRHDDGGVSREYLCDYLVRPKGADAVVLVLYRHTAGEVEVLLRDGLRPALRFGRDARDMPVADDRLYLFFREVIAGILEEDDKGKDGIRKRAAIEAKEEAGIDVPVEKITFLGAGTFPSPGVLPERLWLCAADVSGVDDISEPTTDGSPMEEGATLMWRGLDDAITDCVAGVIEDSKTEIALRRLKDRFAQTS